MKSELVRIHLGGDGNLVDVNEAELMEKPGVSEFLQVTTHTRQLMWANLWCMMIKPLLGLKILTGGV